MIPNSNNVSPLFVERWPDWQHGVQLDCIGQTAVHSARSGLEQRTRQRARPIYRMTYTESGLEATTLRTRQRRAAAEMRAPLWVPFWSERALLLDDTTTTTARINRDPSADWFAAGHYVALYDGAQWEIREITATAGRLLTTAAGALAFAAGAKAYPLRLCQRLANASSFTSPTPNFGAETLTFETL